MPNATDFNKFTIHKGKTGKFLNDYYSKTNDIVYHFWVGNKSGYIWALTKQYQLFPVKGERMKYLGFTKDLGWPKKMNTGRVIHKPSSKTMRKNKKNRKLLKN